MRVAAIMRDERYSLGSADNDRLILKAAVEALRSLLCASAKPADDAVLVSGPTDDADFVSESADGTDLVEVDVMAEGALDVRKPETDIILSMARSPKALAVLSECKKDGATVLNSPLAVENCSRARLYQLMSEHQFLMPATYLDGINCPSDANDSQCSGAYWIKRADDSPQGGDDVMFAADSAQLALARERMKQNGTARWIVQQHIPGDLVKYYGVRGRMFRIFYPTDDGEGRMGHERHNGPARHYAFDTDKLKTEAERLAALTGTVIYGGDAIITEDGRIYMIDFNDWPSFSRCRAEAAQAIAQAAIAQMPRPCGESPGKPGTPG